MVNAADGETLQGFLRGHLKPGATLHSDDQVGYKALKRDHRHLLVHDSAGNYVLFGAHTNVMDSGRSLMKLCYIGTYHHRSAKHLGRYRAWVAGRHNPNPMNTIAQMRAILPGMVS